MTSNQKTILISGATGSFGSSLTRLLLSTTDHKLRLLARSESRLNQLQLELNNNPRCTFILADIRDKDRVDVAMRGVDEVYAAAALKVVGSSYTHTYEFVKTNIIGTKNIIDSARDNDVGKVLLISSDKACAAFNPYGYTKAVAEALMVEANLHVPHTTKYASVRGGNIWGSKGSVIERWIQAEQFFDVSGSDTTRFHLSMNAWLNFCITVMDSIHGGEIFIPKCRSWRLGSLAEAFIQMYPDKDFRFCPIRDGDKQHETLISEHELRYAKDLSWGYVIEPVELIRNVWNYEPHKGYDVPHPITSDTAARMGIDELRSVIKNGG